MILGATGEATYCDLPSNCRSICYSVPKHHVFQEEIICGRFVFHESIETVLAEFPIDVVDADVTANFNVVPTRKVLAITHRDEHHTL